MKVIKYDPHSTSDTQQMADLYNRNGMYVIPAIKTIRPEDWLLSYQAKEMDGYGYFMIKNDDDQVVGGVGIFKYSIRGDAPRNVLMGGSLLIDKKYRTGSTILQLNKKLPLAFSRTSVGHFISEILPRNRPSLQLSKLNGYFSTSYSWRDLLHYDSYESLEMSAANAMRTNIPSLQVRNYSLVSLASQKMVHNNVIMMIMTPDHSIEMRISFFTRYPYYLRIKNSVMGHLEKRAGTYYLVYRIARPGLFTTLQIDNGRRYPLDRCSGAIKLSRYKAGKVCQARFVKDHQFFELRLQPSAAPGFHRRGFSVERKDLTDLGKSVAGFRLFFDRTNGNVYFKYRDSILLTDVFCQAFYRGPRRFELTKVPNALKIEMINADYHVVKWIRFGDDRIVDKYQVLRATREVMAKTGFLLNHQDYLMSDSDDQKYRRKVPLVDVAENDSFLYRRFFNAKPKDYLIEHANVHLQVVAESCSNQWRFRPLILMKITKGAALQYRYSLTPISHPFKTLSIEQPSFDHSYRIDQASIGLVWDDEVVNLKYPRGLKKIWGTGKAVSQSHPVRLHIPSQPSGYFRRLHFRIRSFNDPVIQFPDGRKKRLVDYMGTVETFGQILIMDHSKALKIVAPHSWLSLYLENNGLEVGVVCERATTVSIF